MTVYLRMEACFAEHSAKGLAFLDPAVMEAERLEPGQIIEVLSQFGKSVLVRVGQPHAEDRGQGIIRMDQYLRQSIKVFLGDTVEVGVTLYNQQSRLFRARANSDGSLAPWDSLGEVYPPDPAKGNAAPCSPTGTGSTCWAGLADAAPTASALPKGLAHFSSQPCSRWGPPGVAPGLLHRFLRGSSCPGSASLRLFCNSYHRYLTKLPPLC